MTTWAEFLEAKAQLAPMSQQGSQHQAQVVQNIFSRPPEGTFVKVSDQTIGPIEKMMPTEYGPNKVYIKVAGGKPFLADLINVPPQLTKALLARFKPAMRSDVAMGDPYARSMKIQQNMAGIRRPDTSVPGPTKI